MREGREREAMLTGWEEDEGQKLKLRLDKSAGFVFASLTP